MKACCLSLVAVFALSAVLGCGSTKQASQSGQPVKVKAVQVIQKDTPMTSEYAGQIQAKNEIKIQARVSGNIIEKLVNGGDSVHKGQPLLRIDPRQYESALNSAQAS